MKKIFALLIALTMLLLFAGCGTNSKSKDTTTTAAATAAAAADAQNSEAAPKEFLDILRSGTWHMKYKTTQTGDTVTEFFAKDGKRASIIETGGVTSRTLVYDGKMYAISDKAQSVFYTDKVDASMSVVPNINDFVRIGEGTAAFAGKNLPYEEYGAGSNIVRYFNDGGKPAGIRTVTGSKTVDIEILSLDQEVPEDVFKIPSNYQFWKG